MPAAKNKEPRRCRGSLVYDKEKGSVGRRGAPVEAIIDPALHQINLFCGVYERLAEDARGGDMSDANGGGTEVEVLIFDFRGPSRRKGPLEAGPDDPTGAIEVTGGSARANEGPGR